MKNTMKIFALAASLSLGSCLEVEVVDRYLKDAVYNTEDQAYDALVGVYSVFYENTYFAGGYSKMHAMYDDLMYTTNGEYESISKNTHTSSSVANNNMWSAIYNGVNNANTLIAEIDRIPFSTVENRNKTYAEALYLRSFFYFDLVRMFGSENGIPLRLKPVKCMEDTNMAPTAAVGVYAQIISDLQEATKFNDDGTPYLPIDVDNNGSATHGAALGLLAKVCLTSGDWDGAIKYANEVIKLNKYRMLDNFQDVWDVENESEAMAEMVFAVPFFRDELHKFGSGQASFHNPKGLELDGSFVAGHNNGTGIGIGFLPVQRWFVQFYHDDVDGLGYSDPNASGADIDLIYKDYRIESTFWRQFLTTAGVVTSKYPVDATKETYLRKYIDPRGINQNTNENDFPVMRFSEIYLILAEAYNEKGDINLACEAINKVRERARKADGVVARDYPKDVPTSLSQQQFRWVVFMERGLEFAGECQRWYDMVRMKYDGSMSMYDYLMNVYLPGRDGYNAKTSTLASRKKAFPIPYNEMIRNKLMLQNTGYK